MRTFLFSILLLQSFYSVSQTSPIDTSLNTLDGNTDSSIVWLSDQETWRAYADETNNLEIVDGLAQPIDDTQNYTFKSKMAQFNELTQVKSMVFKQSTVWDNWNGVSNVGPSNAKDAPVLISVKAGEYYLLALGSTGGYHAWGSSDMINWVDHGAVTGNTNTTGRWVTSAEYKDGLFYIYYDATNDEKPTLVIDDDLTDGVIGQEMGTAYDDPTNGSDCSVFRDDVDGLFHIIYEDWSPLNARNHSWDSPLAGHVSSPDGLNGFVAYEHPPVIDQRTTPTGEIGTYNHPQIGDLTYNIHEGEQNAYGDFTTIKVGSQFYLFCDYEPIGGSIKTGRFTSNSLYQEFDFVGSSGSGHPDPTVAFAEGQFYLVTQQNTDYVSPGPWVEGVTARAGVDEDGDGIADIWTAWQIIKESYDHKAGYARVVEVTDAEIDMSSLPKGYGFQFEYSVDNTIVADVSPLMDSVTLLFNDGEAQVPLPRVENIAFLKTTSQSTTYDVGFEADKAVDGNTNGAAKNKSLSHTQAVGSLNPWWRVDLEGTYRISDINIFNRTDSNFTDRLVGAQLFIGNTNSTDPNDYTLVATLNGNIEQNFSSLTLEGRYVMVYHQGASEIVTLAEVQVYGTAVETTPLENIAYLKTAEQSSTYTSGGEALLAVDGTTNGNFSNGSVSHTVGGGESNPWWRVDLEATYSISDISIFNRTDGIFEDRLIGAKILVGNTKSDNPSDYTEVATLTADIEQNFNNLNATKGRYLMVYLAGDAKIISLAEVQVFGTKVETTVQENLAYLKPTTQSTTDWDGFSANAVDGNLDAKFKNNSVTHTQRDGSVNPWWRVDLENTYDISSISIKNRTDCCGTRLIGAKVMIGNSNSNDPEDYSEIGTLTSATSQEFNSVTKKGRYVLIYLEGNTKILSLAEVQVYGELADTQPEQNLAYLKSTSQSTDYFVGDGGSENAVDGFTDGLYKNGSISHTQELGSTNPWWRVDLEATYDISNINVFNRTDKNFGKRLIGAKILVGNTDSNNPADYTELKNLTADTAQKFDDLNTTGRYIMVYLEGTDKILSLAEVQVYGELVTEVQKPTNVILIMADDMGWGDTSYNGSVFATPNLDDMAAKGIQFNRFYSASAVCSPTRASVLTGRNPERLGIVHANIGRLEADETTLAEVLKANGYTTGLFGKWHLGTMTTTVNDSNRGGPGSEASFSVPWENGFDASFSTEAKVPTYDPMKKENNATYPASFDAGSFYGTSYWTQPTTGLGEGNRVALDDNLQGDDSRVVMDRVLPFIEGAVANNQSFLSVVWFHTPHLPVVLDEEMEAIYGTEAWNALTDNQRRFGSSITAMDVQVGRLREKLTELGISENTMIWFCSDNGPEDNTPTTSGPYRSNKRSLFEGGVRVPGILEWPGSVTATQTDVPMVTSDYYPTILDLLDIENTGEKPLDGISMKSLVNGTMEKRDTPIAFRFDGKKSLVSDCYKLYQYGDDAYQLYNLINDPYETTNIAAANSDIVIEMTAELLNWEASVDSDTGYAFETLTSCEDELDSSLSARNLVYTTKTLLYPNPASDYVNIYTYEDNIEVEKLHVYDNSGRAIESHEINYKLIQNTEFSIRTSHLESAVYVIQLDFVDGTSESHNLIIKHE